jgi:hypothetical protein
MSQNPVVMPGLDIGIEVEFLLKGRSDGDNNAPNLKCFAYAIAASFNESAPDWIARMHQEVVSVSNIGQCDSLISYP